MPRYRKLHVKTVESHDVNDMPDDFTRLFWVLLPLGLCREGRGLDNASWIKAKLFPMRLDVTPEHIEETMCWLAERGMIQRYEVDGRTYFCIPNSTWHKYQGTTVREADSEYPPNPDEPLLNSRPTRETVKSKSSTDADADAHVDADAPAQDQRGTTTSQPAKEKNTPAMQTYLALFGKPTSNDLIDLLDIEGQVGSSDVQAAIRWAHSKGIESVKRMSSICTAARNWKDNERTHGNGTPDPVPKPAKIIYGLHDTPEWLGGGDA